ncbi:MAG: MerR family transcriptional regulator [Desulfobulbus propionicus]|nr:MAG: MerR family transcriptional regulator [Desulfobulbus propionicus]
MQSGTPDTDRIPEKKYFRIGEASKLVGVDAHVLRYWETEFIFIRPFRGKSKQRLYRRQDIQNLLQIRYLLHEEGFTIAGARKFLLRNKTKPSESGHDGRPFDNDKLLMHIKQELEGIQEQLRTCMNYCRQK